MPWFVSASVTRFFMPASRLAPPDSTIFLNAAGLPASVLVGASASVRSEVTN